MIPDNFYRWFSSFPDPWHKARYRNKRRIVQVPFGAELVLSKLKLSGIYGPDSARMEHMLEVMSTGTKSVREQCCTAPGIAPR